jgi:hypothetical protein
MLGEVIEHVRLSPRVVELPLDTDGFFEVGHGQFRLALHGLDVSERNQCLGNIRQNRIVAFTRPPLLEVGAGRWVIAEVRSNAPQSK